jgi:hypothetical protein
MQIYLAKDGKQEGPLSFEQIRAMASAGSLTSTDLAWYEGCPEWIQLSRIPGVFPTPPQLPAVAQSSLIIESGSQVRPWVRYWARLIDLYLFSIGCGFAIGLLARDWITSQADGFLLALVFIFVWCFVEPIFLSTWGTTPGKALLRVTVRKSDGSMLDYGLALSRSFDVWFRGYGLGIPLISFVTVLMAYEKLKKNGITSWDQSRDLRVSHEKIGVVRVILALLLFCAFAYVVGLGNSATAVR